MMMGRWVCFRPESGHWPPQKSAAKLQPLRQSFAARMLERFQESPECRKSQDFRGGMMPA